jgi:hypothetical protein
MPIDQQILDEIETLTAEQLLTELRDAKKAGTKLDPRTLKLAMDIISQASGAKAFKAKEQEVKLKPLDATTDDAADDEVVMPSSFKFKRVRDVMRKNPEMLSPINRRFLALFDEQDGVQKEKT